MFNKVVLLGNLTRDIDLRYSQNNTAIGKTGLAVNRKYTVNGEKREDVCFIDVTFFGRTAEVANQYLKKGSKVLIEGRLNYEQWTDQNGQNRSRHSISVENMEMLDSRPQNSDYHPQNSQYGGSYQTQNYGAGYGDAGYNHQNSANYGYSNQSYNNQNSYQNRPNSAPRQNPQTPPEPRYEENMPEIDVDADLKPASKPQPSVPDDGDEIPF